MKTPLKKVRRKLTMSLSDFKKTFVFNACVFCLFNHIFEINFEHHKIRLSPGGLCVIVVIGTVEARSGRTFGIGAWRYARC